MSKKKCFAINSYYQIEKIVSKNRRKYKVLVIFIKYYLIQGLGIDWLNTLIILSKKRHKGVNIEFYVDCGYDNILSIKMATAKIDYIKLKGNSVILKKIKSIANKNKVLLNPSFNIVDCRNTKNINLKIKKLYARGKK